MPAGLWRVVAWNEPNLLALLPRGRGGAASGKATALAPEVCAALCWQAAHRCKAAGVAQVYCGALSVLPQTGTDARNP